MVVTIIWTRQATEDFRNVLAYLRENWSDDIAETFSKSVYKKIALLERMPEMGVSSGKYENVRRILLSRYNSLYYQYQSDSAVLFLLNIFDNRSNPAGNLFE